MKINRNLFDKYSNEYLYPDIEVTEILIKEPNEFLYKVYFTYLEIPNKYHNFLTEVLNLKESLNSFSNKDLVKNKCTFKINTINQYLSELHALKWITRKTNGEYKLNDKIVFNKNKSKKLIIEITTL
jgi:hypothetical protein